MLKILLRKQMMEVFKVYFYDAKKNKKRSKLSSILFFVLFAVIMVGILGSMFFSLASSLCTPLIQDGMAWLYFMIMGSVALMLGVIGSVFNSYNSLYKSKDNDLLLSMPIRIEDIIASRIINVHILGLLYSSTALVPALIAYYICRSVTVTSVLGSVCFILVVPLFITELSLILGWVIAKIGSRIKNKSFVRVAVSLLFISAYYFFYYKAQLLVQDIISNASAYGNNIIENSSTLYMFGNMCLGDTKSMLIIVFFVVALFVALWCIIKNSFLKIITTEDKISKKAYKEESIKCQTPFMAFLSKEFRRFTSSPNYMLNCGLGIVVLPIAGVVLLIKGPQLFTQIRAVFADHPGSCEIFICAGICMMASMNNMACPSISLEGKSLWIPKSLPIDAKTILLSKLMLQIFLTAIPVLFTSVCGSISLSLSISNGFLFVLLCLSICILSSIFDLCTGLKLPNLSWTNEIVPIKQSLGVMISIFGCWIISILFAIVYMVIGCKAGFSFYLVMSLVATIVLIVLLLLWLTKKGSKIFNNL